MECGSSNHHYSTRISSSMSANLAIRNPLFFYIFHLRIFQQCLTGWSESLSKNRNGAQHSRASGHLASRSHFLVIMEPLEDRKANSGHPGYPNIEGTLQISHTIFRTNLTTYTPRYDELWKKKLQTDSCKFQAVPSVFFSLEDSQPTTDLGELRGWGSWVCNGL